MSLGSSIPNYNDYNTQERRNGGAVLQDSAEIEQSRLLESLEKLDCYNHQSVSTTDDKKSVQTPAFDQISRNHRPINIDINSTIDEQPELNGGFSS
jgi:hypothetical protein